MNKIIFDRTENSGADKSKREITQEGYLKVPAKVARIGLQNYKAKEIGLDDEGYDPDEIITVFRSPDEVFDKESLASFKDKDVTVEHPDDLIDCSTFKDCTVGHAISEGRRDGDFVVVDLLIKDADAIKKVEEGKVNLSAGYSANFEEKKGSFKGEPFTHVQQGIYINHIALVDNPRAGESAKLFDSESKGMGFNFFKRNVSVIDEETVNSIQTAFEDLRSEISNIKTEIQSIKDSKDVEYEINDSETESIVDAVKERVMGNSKTMQSLIREEINRAIKDYQS